MNGVSLVAESLEWPHRRCPRPCGTGAWPRRLWIAPVPLQRVPLRKRTPLRREACRLVERDRRLALRVLNQDPRDAALRHSGSVLGSRGNGRGAFDGFGSQQHFIESLDRDALDAVQGFRGGGNVGAAEA